MTHAPLSAEDVNAVAANIRGFAKNRAEVENFISRSLATANALTELKHHFETELARKALQGPIGTPSNMNPEQAAKFLSEAQLTRLFDSFMQQKLGAVQSMRDNAERDARQVDAVVNTLQSTLSALMNDPSVPGDVRQRFAVTLDAAVEAAAQLPQSLRQNVSA